jgi:hypothetical protein
VRDVLAAQGLFQHPANRTVIINNPDGIHNPCTVLVRDHAAGYPVWRQCRSGAAFRCVRKSAAES